MSFTKIISISSLSGILLTSLPASANYVYANGWSFPGTVEACIYKEKKLSNQLGFKLDDEILWYGGSSNSDSATFFATYKRSSDVSLNYRCDGNTGVMSFGISGQNNDQVYRLYTELFDTLWYQL